MKKVRLFCIPHAGGSSTVYYKWREFLDEGIELFPVELAGRGARHKEPPYDSYEEAVDDIYNQIKDLLDDMPYALTGHSMGCWLIYDLYFKITEAKKTLPIHCFFTGRRAPHITKDEILYHKLPFDEFREKVMALGGVSADVFDNEELCKYFMPVLISDFKMVENYQYRDRGEKINCGISIFSGTKEDITTFELMQWKNHTNSIFRVKKFCGDHFFIYEDAKNVVDTVNNALWEYIR